MSGRVVCKQVDRSDIESTTDGHTLKKIISISYVFVSEVYGFMESSLFHRCS